MKNEGDRHELVGQELRAAALLEDLLILPCGPGWRGEDRTSKASFGRARDTGERRH